MKKVLICIALLSATISYGQKFEGGILLGFANYHGDLVDGAVEIKETQLAFGFFTRYNINEKLSLRANINGAKLTGDDANSSEMGRRERAISFESNLWEVSLYGEWYFMDRNKQRGKVSSDKKSTKKKRSRKRASKSSRNPARPYAFTGLTFAFNDPKLTYGNSPDTYLPEEEVSALKFAIPIGMGLQIATTDILDLGLELGFRTAFSDMLDGVSANGNMDKNDWYVFGGISASFYFK